MKWMYTSFGMISVSFGIIGLFVPVWPTTPFILLSVWLFSRTDKRFDEYMKNTKYIGPHLRYYMEERRMTKAFKVKTLLFLWGGLGISMYLQDSQTIILILLLIGLAVSIHILLLQEKSTVSQASEDMKE